MICLKACLFESEGLWRNFVTSALSDSNTDIERQLVPAADVSPGTVRLYT